MNFQGTWHITGMELWGEDYFNMEVQAFFKINEQEHGNFQFGLVGGYLDGEVVDDFGEERFEFTWEGHDEHHPAFGSGWLRFKDANHLEGKIKFHRGDSSLLQAERSK